MAERKDDGLTLGSSISMNAPEAPSSEAGSEAIRREIENRRAALDEKLGALQHKVQAVQTKAKETLDVAKQNLDMQYQFEHHPWAIVGASVAVGFVAGALTAGDSGPHMASVYGWHSQPVGPGVMPVAAVAPQPPKRRRPRTPRNDLFDTVKLAVGAALTDMARQAIHKYSPALGEQLDKVWKERGLTPMSAASALMGTSVRREDGGSQARDTRREV